MKWDLVKLGDISTIQSGGTPSRSIKEYWENGNISWVKISDIKGKYLKRTEEKITENGLNNSSAKLFKRGTLLYTIFATLGEVCILDIDATTNQAIAGLTFDKKVYTEYAYYFMQSIKRQVANIGRGVAQNNINLSILKDIQIPLPQIETQHKIVQVLDKAQELIDNRKKQIELLDMFVKSTFIEMFGDPVTNSKGWEIKPLGQKCDIVTGNTPPRVEKNNYGDYIEWIKSDNINTPNCYLTKAEEYLSEEGFKKCRFVEERCVLMTCIAGSIKCIGNVAISKICVAFNQQINAIVPKENNVFFLYVLFLLTKQYIQSTINMSLKGILSKRQLMELEFIFPPVSLQNKFADIFEKAEKEKALLTAGLEKLEHNYKSLMQKAFNGELFQ